MGVQQPKQSIRVDYDGPVAIATGRSRKETVWKNKEMYWSEFLLKISTTARTSETVAEYNKMGKDEQSRIKDVGGFVGGTLKSGRRTSDAVANRSLVTLDADFAPVRMWDMVELVDYAVAVYSTHKHVPSAPRLRLIIPLSRVVFQDEYKAISRKIAASFGIDYFDDTTYQPHRLMFWPSTASDGAYFFNYLDAPWLDPDRILNGYRNWRDVSEWPESSRTHDRIKKEAKKQGDPLDKPGVIGAFCRTYTVQAAIEEFLSDVYTPCDDGVRYTYTAGSSYGGLVVYDGIFAYSHHGTDPAGDRTCNAFDLVRIHKFGHMDEDAPDGTETPKLPSFERMMQFAANDKHVKVTIGEERIQEAKEEFGELRGDTDWLGKMAVNSKGGYASTIENVRLVLENDERLKGKIATDQFACRVTVLEDLPWKRTSGVGTWTDADDASLRHLLEKVYGIKGKDVIHDGLHIVVEKNGFHPVRNYLEGLEWDGLGRAEKLFVDYLGADDTEYTRAVTRKILVAAVGRVMKPGTKFDCMLILTGPQGIGKSLLLKRIGRQWYSDSLEGVQGKEAYELLQGYWIFELGELAATKKADIEAIKRFLSKQEDVYRAAYGRNTVAHPRQCVFFGTTNEQVFLRDWTGNRRSWPVRVTGQGVKKPWDITETAIDQIWAEAVCIWKGGETLYLDHVQSEELIRIQEKYTECSVLEGVVREYLNTPLPPDWDERDPYERRNYIQGNDFSIESGRQRDKVCVLEVWVEALGGDPKHLNPVTAREINAILRKIPDWTYTDSLRFGKYYGRQRAYVRKLV